MSDYRPSRRIVFQGLGALGVAAALAGCGGGGGGGDAGGSTVAAGDKLATTAEVPVGGGLVLGDQRIVITQPTEGEFKAFTAICTHEGNPVTSVEDGQMVCPTHGSHFDISTGEPTSGPAPSALDPVDVEVKGTDILAA